MEEVVTPAFRLVFAISFIDGTWEVLASRWGLIRQLFADSTPVQYSTIFDLPTLASIGLSKQTRRVLMEILSAGVWSPMGAELPCAFSRSHESYEASASAHVALVHWRDSSLRKDLSSKSTIHGRALATDLAARNETFCPRWGPHRCQEHMTSYWTKRGRAPLRLSIQHIFDSSCRQLLHINVCTSSE